MNALEEVYLAGVKLALASERGRRKRQRVEDAGHVGPADVMAQHTGVHPAALMGAPTPPNSLVGHEAAASGKLDAALKNIEAVDPERAMMYKKQLFNILKAYAKQKARMLGRHQ